MHQLSRADALALVDSCFGSSEEWRSPLIKYRLSNDFQSDWKEEVGHWLKTAEQNGFLEELRDRILKRARRGTRSVSVDPNDRRHNELFAELAPAMTAHYLAGTGWSFTAWEPVTGGSVDVDLQFAAPDRKTVMIQVKGSDQPGSVANWQRVNGENDDWVLKAIDHAATQLPTKTIGANLIVACANRNWPASSEPAFAVTHLIGSTMSLGSAVTLPRTALGKFWTPEWRHVSALARLDLVRPESNCFYSCTVLLNPSPDCRNPALPEWFPHARVLLLEGTNFRWLRGEPRASTMPDGTLLTD
jgi:hypothetical protein